MQTAVLKTYVATRWSSVISDRLRSRTTLAALVLVYGAIAIWLQARSHAFQADYAGYPDEPSHYVNGLLVRDYIADRAPLPPFAYAINYYSHYPKVTFGHWPPLFHCLEGLWMLIFSASRTSVMIMMALQMAVLCVTLAWMVSYETDRLAGFAVGVNLLLLPISGAQVSMVMTEILLSLACLAAVIAWARYLSAPSLWRNVCFGILASAAILVKGDGLALAFVPPLTLLLTRNRSLPRRRDFWAAPVVVLVLCGPFYIWTTPIASLGWVGGSKPSVAYVAATGPEMCAVFVRELGVPILMLTGAGLVAALAMTRLRQHPVVSSTLSFLAGGLLFQLIVPAGMEDRKLYYLLPACLAIASAGTYVLISRWRPALSPGMVGALTALLLLAGAVSHFDIVRRYNRGFRDVAALLEKEINGKRAVILVSSNYLGEGLLVASIAESHPRPAPYVVRANQLLADVGWATRGYHLRAATIEMVSQELTNIQPAFLVLEYASGREPVPHDDLLRAVVKKSPDFYRCIFAKTTRTDTGMESLEVYRAFSITDNPPSLNRVYTHLQQSLSHFVHLNRSGDGPE